MEPDENVRFIRERISELIMKSNLSERSVSFGLGHSGSYIHGITSGRTLLTFPEFFNLCDYFEIEPAQFFDSEIKEPNLLNKLSANAKLLNEKELQTLNDLIEMLIIHKKE